jgi:hypothetical protein
LSTGQNTEFAMERFCLLAVGMKQPGSVANFWN